MRLLPSGSNAVLAELASLAEVMDLAGALAGAPVPGVVDVIPASRTVLVVIDPGATSLAAAASALRAVRPESGRRAPAGTIDIRTRYDGADLGEVADGVGCTVGELVTRHSGQDWVVAFCGFSPGFGYLVAAGWEVAVPRRHSPRARVPTGSVAVGGEFTGVYPRASPGGWQLIGSTDARVFDPGRTPAALFRPGTIVHFRNTGRTA